MSDLGRKAVALDYATRVERTEITVETLNDESRIVFPTRPRVQSMFRGIAVAVLGVAVLGLVSLEIAQIVDVLERSDIVMPLLVLLIPMLVMFIFLRTNHTRVDVLVVTKSGVRLEQFDKDLERDLEIDWEAICTYEFRPLVIVSGLPECLAFETTKGVCAIELNRPSKKKQLVLDVLDSAREEWASQFGAEELCKIEAEQNRLASELIAKARKQRIID